MTANIGGADAVVHGFERGFADRPCRHIRFGRVDVIQQCSTGQDHRHWIGQIFAMQRRRSAMRCFGHNRFDLEILIKRQQ